MEHHNPCAVIQPSLPNWFLFDDKTKPVCTFIPQVIRRVQQIGSTSVKEMVEVRLNFGDGTSHKVSLPVSELERIQWVQIDCRCIINPHYRNARGYIANIIRAELCDAEIESRYMLDRLGIHHADDMVFYVAGDKVVIPTSYEGLDSKFELGELPFRLMLIWRSLAKML